MPHLLSRKNALFYRKAISAFLVVAFSFSMIVSPSDAQLLPNLPVPGQMVFLTPGFQPPVLRGMTVHPENPLLFDFIVDRGQDKINDDILKEESTKLIKYFLASMTIPDKDAWVNLSPYEKDRIVPNALGQTEMGRQMLEQDYILKQLSASLTNPDKELGQKFWSEVRSRAQKQFGTTEIPLNTFNKVWIVPDGATVVEKDGFAYITESKLKVMLDEDYVAQNANPIARSPQGDEAIYAKPIASTEGARQSQKGTVPFTSDEMIATGTVPSKAGTVPVASSSVTPRNGIENVSTAVFREMILPKLVEEVNTGKNFAQTRQVYQSVILAAWYKKALKDSLLGRIYADKSKVEGVESDVKDIKQKVYDQYLEAFKKGVYNVIKEEDSPNGEDLIPRKYFSGGNIMDMSLPASALTIDTSVRGFQRAASSVTSDPNLSMVRAAGAETGENAIIAQSVAASAVTQAYDILNRRAIYFLKSLDDNFAAAYEKAKEENPQAANLVSRQNAIDLAAADQRLKLGLSLFVEDEKANINVGAKTISAVKKARDILNQRARVLIEDRQVDNLTAAYNQARVENPEAASLVNRQDKVDFEAAKELISQRAYNFSQALEEVRRQAGDSNTSSAVTQAKEQLIDQAERIMERGGASNLGAAYTIAEQENPGAASIVAQQDAADASAAEILMSQGLATNPAEALEMVRRQAGDSNTSSAVNEIKTPTTPIPNFQEIHQVVLVGNAANPDITLRRDEMIAGYNSGVIVRKGEGIGAKYEITDAAVIVQINQLLSMGELSTEAIIPIHKDGVEKRVTVQDAVIDILSGFQIGPASFVGRKITGKQLLELINAWDVKEDSLSSTNMTIRMLRYMLTPEIIDRMRGWKSIHPGDLQVEIIFRNEARLRGESLETQLTKFSSMFINNKEQFNAEFSATIIDLSDLDQVPKDALSANPNYWEARSNLLAKAAEFANQQITAQAAKESPAAVKPAPATSLAAVDDPETPEGRLHAHWVKLAGLADHQFYLNTLQKFYDNHQGDIRSLIKALVHFTQFNKGSIQNEEELRILLGEASAFAGRIGTNVRVSNDKYFAPEKMILLKIEPQIDAVVRALRTPQNFTIAKESVISRSISIPVASSAISSQDVSLGDVEKRSKDESLLLVKDMRKLFRAVWFSLAVLFPTVYPVPASPQSLQMSEFYFKEQSDRDNTVPRVKSIPAAQQELRKNLNQMTVDFKKRHSGNLVPDSVEAPQLKQLLQGAVTFDDIAGRIKKAFGEVKSDKIALAKLQKEVLRWLYLYIHENTEYDTKGVAAKDINRVDLRRAIVGNVHYANKQTLVCESATILTEMLLNDFGFSVQPDDVSALEVITNFQGQDMPSNGGHIAVLVKLANGENWIFDLTQGIQGELNVNVAHKVIKTKDGKILTVVPGNSNLKSISGWTFNDINQQQNNALVMTEGLNLMRSLQNDNIRAIEMIKKQKLSEAQAVLKHVISGIENFLQKNTGALQKINPVDPVFRKSFSINGQTAGGQMLMDSLNKLKVAAQSNLEGSKQVASGGKGGVTISGSVQDINFLSAMGDKVNGVAKLINNKNYPEAIKASQDIQRELLGTQVQEIEKRARDLGPQGKGVLEMFQSLRGIVASNLAVAQENMSITQKNAVILQENIIIGQIKVLVEDFNKWVNDKDPNIAVSKLQRIREQLDQMAKNNPQVSDRLKGEIERLKSETTQAINSRSSKGALNDFSIPVLAIENSAEPLFALNQADEWQGQSVVSSAAGEDTAIVSAPVINKDQYGGIDFDPSKLNLQIKRDGRGVPLPLPQQNLENININGLYPVIINIMPINIQTLPILSQVDVQPDMALSKS